MKLAGVPTSRWSTFRGRMAQPPPGWSRRQGGGCPGSRDRPPPAAPREPDAAHHIARLARGEQPPRSENSGSAPMTRYSLSPESRLFPQQGASSFLPHEGRDRPMTSGALHPGLPGQVPEGSAVAPCPRSGSPSRGREDNRPGARQWGKGPGPPAATEETPCNCPETRRGGCRAFSPSPGHFARNPQRLRP